MVEVQACKRAIQVAVEINVEKLHLELDNAAVAAAINNPAKDLSAKGPCIQEIKEMFQHFREVKVTRVSRDANSAADKLAKISLGDDLCKIWFSVPPECILGIISDGIPSFVQVIKRRH